MSGTVEVIIEYFPSPGEYVPAHKRFLEHREWCVEKFGPWGHDITHVETKKKRWTALRLAKNNNGTNSMRWIFWDPNDAFLFRLSVE